MDHAQTEPLFRHGLGALRLALRLATDRAELELIRNPEFNGSIDGSNGTGIGRFDSQRIGMKLNRESRERDVVGGGSGSGSGSGSVSGDSGGGNGGDPARLTPWDGGLTAINRVLAHLNSGDNEKGVVLCVLLEAISDLFHASPSLAARLAVMHYPSLRPW